jgi:ubiquinone/menaquinone biosynthesis C-methylase UbiE
MEKISKNKIRASVMENYRKVALSNEVPGHNQTDCCGTSKSKTYNCISTNMGYSSEECTNVPEGANLGLGCGNPQAIAALKPGDTVLDLGSGGGFDCFLAAKSVGESGKVIGVDMTPEMISLSRSNAEKSNYNNTDFRLGEIEHLPVADSTIDVIISNCVINLSPDKEKVFAEAYRVLKPGGKLAISDIVLFNPLPDNLKYDASLYSGCVSGASSIEELKNILSESGFNEIKIEPKYKSREFIKDWAPGREIENYIVSATIEGIKKRNSIN